MRSLFIILFSSLVFNTLSAQVPSTCFEIESILVDACAEGNNCDDNGDPACQCEGKNEMFRFVVGPDDLDVNDMDIDWPNGGNPWQGVCQDEISGDVIVELNATIINCGYLIEPVNGILPAGSNVLMVTSTDMCIWSNSFAGLADTLLVIFQCSGNYFGHFANQSNGSNNLRTIEVDFGAGCYDEATYDRSLLIDQNGDNNPEDGARVDFTWDGFASYVNNGCNAPFEQAEFDAGPNAVLCQDEIIDLNPIFSSEYSSPFWSGGTGTFVDSSDPFTSYIPSGDEPEEFTLQFNATACNGPVSDEITVTNLSNALTGIESSLGSAICEGEVTTLTASGDATLFQWSTGPLAPSIEVDEAGEYTVSVNNACGLSEESILITVSAAPEVTVVNPDLESLCEGASVELIAEGENGNLEWSTLEETSTIEVNSSGWYYVTVTNDCATAIDSVEVSVIAFPTVSILPEGTIELCEGNTLDLSAVGEFDNELVWSTSETVPVITISEAGTYSVTVENECGAASDEVEVIFGGYLPVASISFEGDLLICPQESFILQGEGEGDYTWNGVAGTDTYTVDEPGTYTLLVTNECGSDETSVQVVSDDIPEASILDGPTFAICNGESALVSVYGNGNFEWSNGGSTSTQSFSEPGEYYITASAACGTDTAFFSILEESIYAQATADPLLGEAPLEVLFQNLTPNASNIYWTLEDGISAYGEEANYTFYHQGTQEVVMQVTSPNGCVDETSIFISVGACPFSLYVPKAFTPDGDRVNDLIKVEGNCISTFEWLIFDRWGRNIYSSVDPDEQWSGADASGYAVSNGIYPYIITVTDQQAETHRFSGSITVIR